MRKNISLSPGLKSWAIFFCPGGTYYSRPAFQGWANMVMHSFMKREEFYLTYSLLLNEPFLLIKFEIHLRRDGMKSKPKRNL